MSETQKSVLVVEDIPLERKLLTQHLRKAGYSVVSCSKGKPAIRKVAADPSAIGVVLLDMKLPDVSGLEVFRGIRHRVPSIPIVLTPGLADSDETRAALAEGANGCLPKPLDYKQVAAVVAAHLNHSG